MKVEVRDLIGRQEIATMLGVEVDTVKRWRLRGLMPEPLVVVSDMPLWHRRDIERWYATRDRR
jgi:hypothetical protein